MGWWKTFLGAMDAMRYEPADLIGEVNRAERLTSSQTGVEQELVGLGEREVILAWLRELGPGSDGKVFVHQEWGTIFVVADEDSVGVFWTDGRSSWVAVPPGAAEGQALTAQQIERVVLDATTSSGPPRWPEWSALWGPAATGAGCKPRRRSARVSG
jgi:hypothetical protein